MWTRKVGVLFFLGFIAACGGQTAGSAIGSPGSDGGDSSSVGNDGSTGGASSASGSSSGSSGGPADGSSSGNGGGSSGADGSSGGGGSSSGGGQGCAPMPGCGSTTQCPAGDGCNTCYCEQGQWACTGMLCVQDGGGNVNCPPLPAMNNTACGLVGEKCDWPGDPTLSCSTYECTCFPGYEWYCRELNCQDAGVRDGGSTCPQQQPAQASSCTEDGLVCPYGVCLANMRATGTNCLCSNGAWDCATVAGCGADGGP